MLSCGSVIKLNQAQTNFSNISITGMYKKGKPEQQCLWKLESDVNTRIDVIFQGLNATNPLCKKDNFLIKDSEYILTDNRM